MEANERAAVILRRGRLRPTIGGDRERNLNMGLTAEDLVRERWPFLPEPDPDDPHTCDFVLPGGCVQVKSSDFVLGPQLRVDGRHVREHRCSVYVLVDMRPDQRCVAGGVLGLELVLPAEEGDTPSPNSDYRNRWIMDDDYTVRELHSVEYIGAILGLMALGLD